MMTVTKPMRFREVQVGQWFDFIGDKPWDVTCHVRCVKISARKYSYAYNNGIDTSQVGSINVLVYHVSSDE